MRTTGPAVALAVLALTACTGDGDPVASPTPASTSPVPTTTIAPPTSAPPTSTLPPGCESPAPAPAGATVITSTVRGGTVSPPRKTYSVTVGSQVRVVVTADTADEVHVHTYDRKADTTPGCPTVLDFAASIPGTVEVELEEAGLNLFDLKAR